MVDAALGHEVQGIGRCVVQLERSQCLILPQVGLLAIAGIGLQEVVLRTVRRMTVIGVGPAIIQCIAELRVSQRAVYELRGLTGSVGFEISVVQLEPRAELRGGIESEREASSKIAVVREMNPVGRETCRGREGVGRPAFRLGAVEGNSGLEGVGQRARDVTLEGTFTADRLVPGRDAGFELAGWIRRPYGYYASRAVLAEKESLRTLQDLDLLHVHLGHAAQG